MGSYGVSHFLTVGRPRIYLSAAQKEAVYCQRKRRLQPIISDAADEWKTPAELFAALDAEFSFTLDLAVPAFILDTL